MSYKCIFKGIMYRFVLALGFLCVLNLFIFGMGSVPVFGQIYPYSLYYQQPLSLFLNPYINNYPVTSAFNGYNPYLGLYNSFSVLNRLSAFSTSPLYPQASIAGGLVPFTNFNINPFGFPYSVAATYFAAAITPADVAGTWSGVWVSTFLAGGVTTGDLSITLAQSGTDVTGTLAFFLNKILKFGADVVGTINGNTLNLTSTVIPGVGGTKSFDVTVTATVNGINMDGTYLVINNVTGNIAEEGTFTATRL